MLSIDSINQANQKVTTGKDFPRLAEDLKQLGVTRVDVFVINGSATYYGTEDDVVQGAPFYEELLIETESSASLLKESLQRHQAGETEYQTFCKEAAMAGIEKWVVDLKQMQVIYLDAEGNEVLMEHIPSA